MTPEEFQNEAAHLRQSLVSEAMQYVRRADVAEDIVQDCLVRLWDMCGDLRSPMAALARIVTRNLCLDFVRRTPHTEDVAQLPQVDEADGTAERHEAVDRMMDIVTELPLVQQTVLRIISVFAFGCSLGIAVCNTPPGFRCRKAVPRGLFVPLFIKKDASMQKLHKPKDWRWLLHRALSIVFSRTVVTVVLVLAQASMAVLIPHLQDVEQPVLYSLVSGVKRLKELLES